MELKVDDFVKNIKRPYLTVLGVFVVAVSLFFDAIMFFYAKLYDKLPMYLLVFMAFTAVILIMMYIQEKNENYKVEKDMWLDISHLTLLWDILCHCFLYLFTFLV